jgi:hypothetical protein
MRTNDFWALAFLLPATCTIVACAAETSGKKNNSSQRARDDDDDDDRTTRAENNVTESPKSAEVVQPPPVIPDAAAPLQPPPQNQVTNFICQELMRCGASLGFVEQIGVSMIAQTNKTLYCSVGLAACRAGYLDLGGVFGGSKQKCGDLAECCGQMWSTTKQDECRRWAQAGTEDQCGTQLSSYRSQNLCR